MDEGPDSGLWKLILGDESQYIWTGPNYPNITTNFDSQNPVYTKHCGNGCLFELRSDPFERVDLAQQEYQRVAKMTKKLEMAERTAFNPHRGRTDPRACQAARDRGNFWGPFLP